MKYKNIIIVIVVILINNIIAQLEFPSTADQPLFLERFSGTNLPLPTTESYLDEAMPGYAYNNEMNRLYVAGLAACVISNGQVVWHKNYGYANISHNRPVNDNTIFKIASISKNHYCHSHHAAVGTGTVPTGRQYQPISSGKSSGS